MLTTDTRYRSSPELSHLQVQLRFLLGRPASSGAGAGQHPDAAIPRTHAAHGHRPLRHIHEELWRSESLASYSFPCVKLFHICVNK